MEGEKPFTMESTMESRTVKLDPGIIDHIRGGKPNARLMKEALKVVLYERQAEYDKLQALDDLEMVRPVSPMIEPCVSWLLTMENS